ncbi:hypothetical protein N8I77_011206 [Diaporthe amygdali]|uniref:Major facilitator superfamily (MFS) profile domain-containing protein n=1 Tax=Phomopsis amygdali TaxID=1214568 RepID=A0AAD9W0U2_PHOAM|nr:hypothetical protein N8I77_011206 [Diaporthe amygdali]
MSTSEGIFGCLSQRRFLGIAAFQTAAGNLCPPHVDPLATGVLVLQPASVSFAVRAFYSIPSGPTCKTFSKHWPPSRQAGYTATSSMDEKDIQGTAQPTIDQRARDEQPFTIFTIWERRWIVFLSAFAGMFSPMSSFIFYPAITAISNGLSVSIGLVNLAITTYMIVSGIAPALLGNAADTLGRRPIYILVLVIYLGANIGLALQNSFPALLVLRMLQSAGSSGTISLGYGVLSDVTTPADRGSYVGIMLIGPNVAPPIGPIIGGALAATWGWHSIFWFLCILGSVCLLLVLFTLPETARCLVGNGSIPAHGVNRTFTTLISEWRKPSSESQRLGERPKLSLPNPLASLKLLLLKDVAIVLVCNGIYYMIYCCAQASLSSLFIDVYHYDELASGLVYIPFGVACLISLLVWGRVLDYDYARLSRRLGAPAGTDRSDDADEFPIERARLNTALYLVGLNTLAMIGYGWAVAYRAAFGTLLTDLNPTRSSTASASANIVRCAFAATALAVLELMIDRLGIGWTFTFFALCGALCGPLMLLQMKRGQCWRRRRGKQSSQPHLSHAQETASS